MIRKNAMNLSEMKKSPKMSVCDVYTHTNNANTSQCFSTFGDNNTDRNIKPNLVTINNLSYHTCISNKSNGKLTQRN
jgi:hypothetical protein